MHVLLYFETECIIDLQGHPRLLILAPIESMYVTSYWSSIVTLVISFRDTAGFLLKTAPYPYSMVPPKFWGVPIGLD